MHRFGGGQGRANCQASAKMVPLGLALGINKQTWKNDSYNNLTIKIGQEKKMVQALA